MSKTIYTEEQFKKAKELKISGTPVPEISLITGIKKPSLIKFFSKNGIKLDENLRKKVTSGARWAGHAPIMGGKKVCSICKQSLELSLFYTSARAKTGYLPSCISCQKNAYHKDPEPKREKAREYRKNNLEKVRQGNRAYLEKLKQQGIIKRSTWHIKNPEKAKESAKKWRDANTSQRTAKNSLYRATKAQRTPPWLSLEHKKQLQDFYKNCPKGYEVDHIVPMHSEFVSGLHVPWNLQYLKKEVNNHKWAHFVDQNAKPTCFQYERKLATQEGDRRLGLPFGSKLSDFTFSKEDLSKEHSAFIERYEWLGKMGYIHKPEIYVARHKDGHLGGVVIIDEPNSPTSRIPKGQEALIQRGATASWTPKNLGSKLVMFACRESAKNTSRKFFMGYSDPEAGEVGTIYQACNFMYLGHRFGASSLFQLSSGKSVSSSYFRKTSTYKRYAKELGILWKASWCKENGYKDIKRIPPEVLKKLKTKAQEEKYSCDVRSTPPKGKYLMILGKDKKETKTLRKQYSGVFVPFPYCKRPPRPQS